MSLSPARCVADECDRKIELGPFCLAHYHRNRRGQDMDAPLRPKEQVDCSVEVCDRPRASSDGLCSAHYRRSMSGLPLDSPIVNKRLLDWPQCSFVGCDRVSETKSTKNPLCIAHASQRRSGKELKALRQFEAYDSCRVPECTSKPIARGLCNAHGTRMRMYNITPERLIEIVTSPCQICLSDGPICIDHDHACCPGEGSCGECVRGGLCSGCNLGLGAFRDDLSRLGEAMRYLEQTSARIVTE